MNRLFSERQRTSLYLAAEGKCQRCGTDLAEGFEADHIVPWVAGGTTTLGNGHALCPSCNRKKGSKLENTAREWQNRAWVAFMGDGEPKRDFLLSATPGAGKTFWALNLARELLGYGKIDKIVVVAPSDALREQWRTDSKEHPGLQFASVTPGKLSLIDISDFNGLILTYQQIKDTSIAAERLAEDLCLKKAVMVILDEIHHAGDDAAWGRGLYRAFKDATFRLCLTGTPWRRDPFSQIPFVRYSEDGKVVTDFAYEYGDAVRDLTCRTISFQTLGGEVEREINGKVANIVLGEHLAEVDVPDALTGIYDPGHPWILSAIRQADASLNDLREEFKDAAGLLVADDILKAKAYKALIKSATGSDALVIVSDEDPSQVSLSESTAKRLDDFKNGNSKWLIAVKMVSEGVNIPRLAVGIYASRIRTPLFFRQIVGRFVRMREVVESRTQRRFPEQLNAQLFLPAIPDLIGFAKEIQEELRHVLEERLDDPRLPGEGGEHPRLEKVILGTSEADLKFVIQGGMKLSVDEVEEARGRCQLFGIPVHYASNVAQALRGEKNYVEPAFRDQGTPTVSESNFEIRERLRSIVTYETRELANRWKSRYPGDKEKCNFNREVNSALLKAGFPRRDDATNVQLQEIIDWIRCEKRK